ncbi:MAG TPA: CRISPR-associated endonuclease Cas2, partial [Phnomibacter sp.]|nr:CRISPR-associated endonuclease Cas2 [Phnomibacter sp.]
MLSQTRLNAYRIIWLFVFFDLPVETKKQRKAATDFRKTLIKAGFTMLHFSVSPRHCASDESADAHLN